MNHRTQETIERLETADWFCAVGRNDTENATILSSWKEAIESCASEEWQDLLLEAKNQYTEKLVRISKERFNQWNIIGRELKAVTIPLVSRKLQPVMDREKLPKIFEDTVNWDILNLAMEAEYADVYPPGFFTSQGYWYIKGHFPCGWQGSFPEGKLIIY